MACLLSGTITPYAKTECIQEKYGISSVRRSIRKFERGMEARLHLVHLVHGCRIPLPLC